MHFYSKEWSIWASQSHGTSPIRSLSASSRDVLEMLKVLVQRCVNNVLVNIALDLCIICYRQRESIVTCEIVVIPMNSRSIVLTCIKSLLSFNHSICTFDFFNICELSFNCDLAYCWRAFDMSNKYYLLTYLLPHF